MPTSVVTERDALRHGVISQRRDGKWTFWTTSCGLEVVDYVVHPHPKTRGHRIAMPFCRMHEPPVRHCG